ncbi:MAG: DUF4374 domain-containing protein [Prevotellaceae bacterium]|jgi:hypothetical protein|nr:DUF4374 domain-containing protein [Prevotellaceae bacterium]
MMTKKQIKKAFLAGFIGCLALSFASCDSNEYNPTPTIGSFFLSVSGETAEYIIQTNNLETGNLSISDNNGALEKSGYTWIFNENPSVAVGLIYNQGDPGVCLAYGIKSDTTLTELKQFQIESRFTSYGFFDKYALTSVGGVTPVDESGNALVDGSGNVRSDGATFNFFDLKNLVLTSKTITTLNITGNGDQATFSGIVDMGNGEFLTGMVVSQPKAAGAGGGASSGTITYPDSVWVAAFDAILNLKRIYRDDRISYSSGRFRSQYYSQIGKADDGSVYVFSGSYESATTKPCGALKINKNATEFDPSYYFNIEQETGGYRFRKVWHITGNYFLLELYNDFTITTETAATQYGIVNMGTQKFSWLSNGFPAKNQITATGLPMAHDGKMYFPIVTQGNDPAIYIIDPATASAKKGISITGAKTLNAIGRLIYQ